MAARVRFLADYIYTPSRERRVSTKFKAGQKIHLVTEECAVGAIAAGVAELAGSQPATKPKKMVAVPVSSRTPRARRAKTVNA